MLETAFVHVFCMAFYSTNKDCMCTVNAHCNLVIVSTVSTECMKSCIGIIENSSLFYLNNRKIVFKNTLLSLWVHIKVEFVCTVRQYFCGYLAVIFKKFIF